MFSFFYTYSKDPNSNVIKRWSNLRNESYGVVAKSLNLDDQPVLGAWSIKATVGGATKRAVVNVDEYGSNANYDIIMIQMFQI